MARQQLKPGEPTNKNFWLYDDDREALAAIKRQYGLKNDSEAIRQAILVANDETRSTEITSIQADLVEAQEERTKAQERAARLNRENDSLTREVEGYRASPLYHQVPAVQAVLLVCVRSKEALKRLYDECLRAEQGESTGNRVVGQTPILVKARKALLDAGEDKPWVVLGKAIRAVHDELKASEQQTLA